ncbi:MAG TPA: PAAR domain-containing protein [Xanthobacteraceae bacterium]|nr:PAAR domain-containing protein [Xanthobacteraceae bacterium]
MRSTMRFSISPIAIFIVCGGLGMAAAQPSGAIITGSPDAVIADKPAARVGDGTASGTPVVEGSHDVFINGRPAAIAGGRTGCGGVVVGGSANVFINRRPAAQAGSPTSDCSGR